MSRVEPARADFVEVNRTRLRVWHWGDPRAPVVLFMHGGFDHGRMFDELAPRVAALGYHAVAVDARGHGDSGRLTSGITWLTQVLDFALLARELGAPVGVVAHSMGGGQALSLAGAFPELVRWIVNIDGLGPPAEVMVDVDNPAEAMNQYLERALRIRRRPPREWESLEAMADQRGRVNVRLSREWLLHLAEHGSAPGPNGGRVWKFDPILTIDLPSPFGYEQLLAQHRLVACPVLVLTGDETDTWNEVHGDELDRRIANMPNARVVHVRGTGHYVHIEDPDSTMRRDRSVRGRGGPVNPIVVVHDVGGNGGAWRDALSTWPGDAVAPDLDLQSATGDRTDVVWLLIDQMEAWRDRAPIIVGCGEHSLAAETFALAGWVGGLVLVDGLGGAWTTPVQQVAAQNVWLRSKFEDPNLIGYPAVWFESFACSLRTNVGCPALLVETPASTTPSGDAERRAEQFARPAALVRLDDADPARVLATVRGWWDSQADGR